MYSIDYQYLRPKKAEALKAWYDEPLAVTENPAVWRGKNATILPLRRQAEDNLLFGRGGVVDENGEYVPLSGIDDWRALAPLESRYAGSDWLTGGIFGPENSVLVIDLI